MLKKLKDIYEQSRLPDYATIHNLLDNCISTLEAEDESYRPKSSENDKTIAGGLLDFSKCDDKLVVVVPDLHARREFILNLLTYKIPSDIQDDCNGLTILEALEQDKIRIVCVGDLFHSEARCLLRWQEGLMWYLKGEFESKPMNDEMIECLGLLQMVMILKISFPKNFHILKGNHENILNTCNKGNRSFYKFADEGNMVYDFMACHYDDLIIQEVEWFESSLPVCALFKNLVISHGEPLETYSKNQIIDYHKDYEVVYGLTWTANDYADRDSVENTMKNLLGDEYSSQAVWIGGHRPVSGKYALRQNGKYIQIHNPDEQNVALYVPHKKFNPESDIYSVEN